MALQDVVALYVHHQYDLQHLFSDGITRFLAIRVSPQPLFYDI